MNIIEYLNYEDELAQRKRMQCIRRRIRKRNKKPVVVVINDELVVLS